MRREAWVFRFSLKTGGDGLSVVWPQNHYNAFLVWASKHRSTVWWFGSQNHRDSFFVWASKPSGRRLVGFLVCASKLMSGWRPCEDTHRRPTTCFITKQVGLRFPSFDSKLADERRRVVHVASSWRSRESEAKDGRFDGVGCGAVKVRPNYPSLVVIFLLAHRGIPVSPPWLMSSSC
jgi:hypothetical protein